MQREIKIFIASLLFIYLTLIGWLQSYQYGCLSLVFALLVHTVLSSSYIGLKMQERECLRRCYFQESSLLFRILGSNILVIIFYFIFTLAMSSSILLVILDLQKTMLIYILTFNMLITFLLYRGVAKVFFKTLIPSYRYLFAREWSIKISSFILVIVTMVLFYYGTIPEYLSGSLEESMIQAGNLYGSQCYITDILIKIQQESNALFWWMVVASNSQTEYHTVKLFVWFGFLLFNALGLYGINRYMLHIIYLVDRAFSRADSDA